MSYHHPLLCKCRRACVPTRGSFYMLCCWAIYEMDRTVAHPTVLANLLFVLSYKRALSLTPLPESANMMWVGTWSQFDMQQACGFLSVSDIGLQKFWLWVHVFTMQIVTMQVFTLQIYTMQILWIDKCTLACRLSMPGGALLFPCRPPFGCCCCWLFFHAWMVLFGCG